MTSTSTSVATIKILVKEIGSLSASLSDSVPKGSKDDKIWSVMNTDELDNPHETFNRRFDAMFAEDCRDVDGYLHHVRQGKLGMGLVVSYLSKINWTTGFPLDLVELKLQRLVIELKRLQYVSHFFIICTFLISEIIRRIDAPRPVRHPNLTAKLKDTANTSVPELSFQRKAVQDYHSRPTEDSSSHPTTSNDPPSGPSLSTLDTPSQPHHIANTTSTPRAKRSFLSITSDNDEDDTSSTQPAQCNFFFSVCASFNFFNFSTVIYSQ